MKTSYRVFFFLKYSDNGPIPCEGVTLGSYTKLVLHKFIDAAGENIEKFLLKTLCKVFSIIFNFFCFSTLIFPNELRLEVT